MIELGICSNHKILITPYGQVKSESLRAYVAVTMCEGVSIHFYSRLLNLSSVVTTTESEIEKVTKIHTKRPVKFLLHKLNTENANDRMDANSHKAKIIAQIQKGNLNA